MAQQHDLFDDIIDISKGLSALRNPLGDVTDSLMGVAKGDAPQWNPADYKEKPRANASRCMACIHEGSSCSACKAVCPVDAIEIEDGGIEIKDTCRKCGLCVSACPTEALSSPRTQPKKLYDAIAEAAIAHETAYVTCTRALRRSPRENEILLACVGDVPAEVWFSILTDFPNVSVFLPLDICSACKNVKGEEALSEEIAKGEEWAGAGLGLEVERRELVCRKRREYERKEFLDKIVKTTGLAVTKFNPAAVAVTTAAQAVREHRGRLSALERALGSACGTTTQKTRRVLMQRRELVISTLQAHPDRAQAISIELPECDQLACTTCGECVRVCPTHAADITAAGKFEVEPAYCIGCGLCVEACGEHALKMSSRDAGPLVIEDEEAKRKAWLAEEAKRDAAEAKESAKRTLNRILDQVEKLDS